MRKSLQSTQHVLRTIGLLQPVDRVREQVARLTTWRSNRGFRREHPDFAVPPAFLAFDAYGNIDWAYYHLSGSCLAAELAETFRRYAPAPSIRLLEWGCGPARVLRHMPTHFPSPHRLHGSDLNPDSVRWAEEHVPGVAFHRNGLAPPMDFADESFDVVYALSVFTHLGRETGLRWMGELRRLLAPGGLLLFTTHSDTVAEMLLPRERRRYEEEGCCVRENVPEGRKMFSAWHHPDYVHRALLAGFQLVEHRLPGAHRFIHTQDTWLARKPDRSPEDGG